MNFSYWENKELIGENDVVIIGSGITGLIYSHPFKEKITFFKGLVIRKRSTSMGCEY